MLTGQNGILTQAQEAKTRTDKASIIEQVRVDILGEQVKKQGKNIDSTELQTILKEYFINVPEKANDLIGYEGNLETKEEYGGYNDIKLSDIYKGTIERGKEPISETESFVKYYADIDDDGTIDGIIYADLGVNQKNTSGILGNYTIPKEEGELKQYYKKNEKVVDERFDTVAREVIAPINKEDISKKDRFYVMALEDFYNKDYSTYYWYYNARGNMSGYGETIKIEFGEGKTNTANMIEKWKPLEEGGYGNTNDRDIWGVIQKADKNGKIWNLDKWFVPSSNEWRVFVGELEITTDNYDEIHKMSNGYWSSSTSNSYQVHNISLLLGSIFLNGEVNTLNSIRLSATF